ncbi:MAG: N-acetylneuraminate synthase family protein [Candidatus Omnitrophica bacterium]|nr:N-acetylneuraminate synthase family protein [Candidatus Omnitrophota bacterium]
MKRELKIDEALITDDSDCFVIAEIGHNHQGSVQKAMELIRTAKECGANAVKFQKRNNRQLYTKSMYEMPYSHENSFGATYGEHRENLELDQNAYGELKHFCRELGITFFATPFDFSSADFLARLDMPVYKTASGDLKNIPLLKYIAGIGKPMLVSTGGAGIEDVRRAYEAVMPVNPQLCILQCTASYPVSYEELNLNVITTYRNEFPDIVIGLSDHENGIAMATAAYVLGARVIEKHFTINHTWKGTDHVFSLEPIGFRKLVRDLKRVRLALGDGRKRSFPSESGPLEKMGKKLVAAKDIPAGHVLTEADIAIKSPGNGLAPYELENVLGKAALRLIQKDENITWDVLAGMPESAGQAIVQSSS